MKRFIVNMVLVILVATGPWWLLFSLLLFALFYFRMYYESLAIAVVVDILYSAPFFLGSDFHFLWTLSISLLFFVIEFSKRNFHSRFLN